MKNFRITIPAFEQTIQARSRKEALGQFWFGFDAAQEDPLWGEPIIKEITK